MTTGGETWEQKVDRLRREGAPVLAPNGLPIRCIRHDGLLMEIEHADHPDYKFPVEIVYTGDKEDVTDRYEDGTLMCVEDSETHALLWTDGSVALTIYECNYSLWLVRSGELLLDRHRTPKGCKWRVSPQDLQKIQELAMSQNRDVRGEAERLLDATSLHRDKKDGEHAK